MGSHAIWVTIIVAFQISAVLGRNNYYEYYYSRYHHKSHSTTAALSPSTTDISPELKTESSVSADFLPTSHRNGTIHSYDNDLLENIKHMSTADFVPTPHRNGTIHSYGNTKGGIADAGPGFTIGIVLLVLFVLEILFCCCCAKGCRTERKGFVLRSDVPVLSEQSLLNQAVHPNYTNEPPQQCPTNYQPQPVLPPYYSPVPTLYQHNPVSQIYGIPEAPPPPYDAPTFEAPPYKN